jgi:spore germination protein KC
MNISILRKIARVIAVFSLFPSLLLLSGCWDRVEVNDLALISAAGIDKKSDNTIELSVQVFIPRSTGTQGMSSGGTGGGTSDQTMVRSAEGITFADAMMKLQEELPRTIFWGHDEIFVIGSELAREGIQPLLDFMVRHPQIRQSAFIFISKNKAKRQLELMPPLERSSSEVLREMARSGVGMKVSLKDVIQRLSSDAGAVGLPWVEELPDEPGQSGLKTSPYISGTAVFKKDKLVGHINDELTRGVLWLRNEIKQAMITVKPDIAEGLISMKLLRGHTRLIPKIENGKWKITVMGETEDDIVQNGTNLRLMNPKFARMLEKDVETDIQNRMQEALDQVQINMKADVLGFARAFHRKYPGIWRKEKQNWDEIFPKVEVSFNIKAHVRRPGMTNSPAGLQPNEVRQK